MSFDDILLNCRLCQESRGTIAIAYNDRNIKKIYEYSGIEVSR